MEFKDILLDLMNERELNQRQLSQQANIPVTTISGWLTSNKLPDYFALKKLSQFFNVSSEFLLNNENDYEIKANLQILNNNMTKFGNKLKELRLENSLKQQDLAAKIGVSNGAVSFWENDIKEPKYSYLVKIAELFNVSVDYLLGLETDYGVKLYDNLVERKNSELNLTGKEIDLMKMYRELNELFQAQVIGFVKSLIMQQSMNVVPQNKK